MIGFEEFMFRHWESGVIVIEWSTETLAICVFEGSLTGRWEKLEMIATHELFEDEVIPSMTMTWSGKKHELLKSPCENCSEQGNSMAFSE